ncbi:MAG TPA: Mur ligase family protein [Candidatus Saccharimonadales bacterium]|nr:Mur ligase family protein [Candidatus Saccharimonadales bacterium]
MSVPIISVTGTKGKTTTVAVIADVLRKLDHNVLKVDTTGHYVNGEQKSTLDDSRKTWRLVPTVCPGRFLWEFYQNPKQQEKGVAVLECALGSSAAAGLGYRNHNVGVFLNVFEDHLGSSSRLKTKQDIADAKEFVFKKLDRDNSFAVFNAEDPLVCGKLPKVPSKSVLIPCGMKFEHFDIKSHLAKGGMAVTTDGSKIILRKGQSKTTLLDLTNIPWAFKGQFQPSVLNLMHSAAAVIAFYSGQVPEGFKEAFESVRLDPYGGRLTLLKAANGATILADYAHEKVSMKQVADLARTLAGGGEVIGVVRLAKDRTDKLIKETGEVLAESYDKLIVFDKIDGYWKKPSITTGRFPEVVGRVSEVLAGAIAAKNRNVERIIREDQAIARAAEIAKPEDVIVVIVNDDIRRSIGFIKESFKAEFI